MPALADAFRHPPLAQAFGDPALLAGMLRFEAALAYAQADAGIVPRAAAATIERVCDTLAAPAALDVAQLAADARRAGTLAIPLVKALTAAVAAQDPAAARHVHIGATSQDLLDTALALAQRDAARMLLSMLEPLGDSLAQLARQHRHTMMNGRTLLQAATPVPFGWKAAGWLDPLTRSRVSLAAASDAAAVLQFGGAAGTLAALGEHGTAVAAGLARRLELAQPQIAWHGARDRVARLAAELAIVCGAAAK
ncbi:MAG TPA: lyase family protein, partial [Burkholderiaceae bacterium]|nr:lyase family protein [Burkholderiaceae bacterium]